MPRVSPVTGRDGSAHDHFPVLDGLRGVAILLVLMYHLVDYVPSGVIDRTVLYVTRLGWVGVDLFFVLSGFLITGILLETRGEPRYFSSFYARRALRIFPLYYAFVAGYLLAAPYLFPADIDAVAKLHDRQWWYWSHGTNILLAAKGGWPAAPLNTTHLWSLALEEQFYLVWPLVVLFAGPRRLPMTCVALASASLLARVALSIADVRWVSLYVLPFTRLEALTFGAFIATAIRSPAMWARVCSLAWPVLRCSLLALAAGLVADIPVNRFSAYRGPFMHTIGYSLVALVGAAMLILVLAARNGGVLHRVIDRPSLRLLGKHSYALYLLHPPLLLLAQQRILGKLELPALLGLRSPAHLAAFVVLMAIALALSMVTWYALERPILRLKRFVPRPAAPSSRSWPWPGQPDLAAQATRGGRDEIAA